jgi:O-antigen/teichoic acid export membrane protein
MNFRFTLASAFVIALPLVFFGRWIILKWAGSAAVPSRELLVLMGIWSLINGAMISQSCLLASAGRVKRQTIYSIAAAATNLILSIVLVQRMGLPGVILGTIAAFATCIIVPQTLEVERAISP